MPDLPEGETRTVRVNCTWRSEHEVEVPADWKDISAGDLGALLRAMQQVEPGADLTAATAELVDWQVVW